MEAKALAVCQRPTLTRLIEEGLQMRLKSEQQPANISRLPMPVFPVFPVLEGEGGLAPGLSGLSTREMLDLLDTPEHAA